MSSHKMPKIYRSPIYLILIIAASIFIMEMAIMYILDKFPDLAGWLGASLDSSLLTMMMAPMLYFFLLRPLLLHINQTKEATVALGKSKVDLEKSNEALKENREKIILALNKISDLLMRVELETDLNVRFDNPNLEKCYEVMKCKDEECFCYGREAIRCWQIAGTYCAGEVQGAFAKKIQKCNRCDVFRRATSDPIYHIGEHFNNIMHILAVKNSELVQAYNELKSTQAKIVHQEKMASIGQLAAGVAHEINNPTGFVSSNLGTLGKYVMRIKKFIDWQGEIIKSMDFDDALTKSQDERKRLKLDYILHDVDGLIEESLDGTERIKKIVQNLKSFARADGKEFTTININECIESTLNIVWNELKYKAKVEKEYGEIPMTKCYPQQLNQVFMNLLVNAAQAIEKQGEIRIRTWSGDGMINISISDTGQGIEEDKLNRIFEPFYTTKEVGKGTGLGLSISYDIVKKHNGDITVESETDRGTNFTVKLPVIC